MVRQTFSVTGNHLLKILNDKKLRKKIKRCDYGLSGRERGFAVNQQIYSQNYKFTSVNIGEVDGISTSWQTTEIPEFPKNYFLLDLHSHSRPRIVYPSFGDSDSEGGDLLCLAESRKGYYLAGSLKVKPLMGIISRIEADSVSLLIVQDRINNSANDVGHYSGLFDMHSQDSTEEVAAELERTGLWNAIALELRLSEDLSQDYASKFDRFSFIPQNVRAERLKRFTKDA